MLTKAQSWPAGSSRLMGLLGLLLCVAALLSMSWVLLWNAPLWAWLVPLFAVPGVCFYFLWRKRSTPSVTLSYLEGIYWATINAQSPQPVTFTRIGLCPFWVSFTVNLGGQTSQLTIWRHIQGERRWRSLKLHLQGLAMRTPAPDKDAI